jgi:hypothetical protein
VVFDPEKHRANQDKVLADLREEFKLLPNLPRIEQIHTIAVALGDDADDSDFVICCHDEANDCKHHVIYPASGIDATNEQHEEQGRVYGHVTRILAAAYN